MNSDANCVVRLDGGAVIGLYSWNLNLCRPPPVQLSPTLAHRPHFGFARSHSRKSVGLFWTWMRLCLTFFFAFRQVLQPLLLGTPTIVDFTNFYGRRIMVGHGQELGMRPQEVLCKQRTYILAFSADRTVTCHASQLRE